jgi:Glycosyl transferase family 2/Glycosyl transferases group 1
MSSPSYRVYVSALGNVFMTEIAEALTDAIAQCGRDVEMHRHGLPGRFPGTINLVVAPHEYFTLYEGASEAAVVKAAAESVCVGVEQPGTYWFEYGARYTSYGPLAIDINRRGVTELRRRGVEAYRLHPGYYSGWDAWGGAASTDRPRDVLFLGSLTHRRAQILSQSAPILAQWTCDLRLFRGDQPVRDGTEGFVSGHAKHELLAGSRVLLNVHQGERDYFEWIRILEAISNGCLVLTERSGGYAPLVPGRHFIQAPAAALAAQVDAMLRDEALRAELALGAYEFVRKSMDWVDNVDRLLTLVEGRLSRGAAPPARAAPATPLPETFRRAGRRSPVAPPSAPSAPPAAKSQVSALFDQAEAHEKQGRSMIKDILVAEVNDSRLIEATIAALEHGSQEYAQVSDTPAYLRATPEVSVVLTHYNYSAFVREAIESVVASTGVRLELVVVDNHSEPEELEYLHSVIAAYEWFPIRLVANAADQGPSASRNIGARHARAPELLLLDADNMLYPTGAQLLHAALGQSDAAFAYGLIEKFGQDTGLLSAVPWDVEHLVRSNYIDTMALIRREVWDEFGGFDPQVAAMGGYDDYAFWLQLAAVGYRGQLVSSFIGRYRVHGTSLQSLLNLDTKEFMKFYRDRHPSLPWPALEGS